MKIASIIGVRPHFIKASALSPAIRNNYEEILIHTGQHYDYEMSQIFFDELGIPEPKYNLGVKSKGSYRDQVKEICNEMIPVLEKENPKILLIYGDANPALGGAMAAFKIGIPIVHVEAGLRCNNLKMPEERNRFIVDYFSDVHFCISKACANNLENEGITKNVYFVGDVIVSVLDSLIVKAEKSNILQRLDLNKNEYIPVAIHRPDNVDKKENLSSILNVFERYDGKFVFSVHPRTKRKLEEYNLKLSDNVIETKSLGYFDYLAIMKNAKKVVTDSFGVQKEAYLLKMPSIILRDHNELREVNDVGWSALTGLNEETILYNIRNFQPSGEHPPLFGDGNAAEKIVQILGDLYG